jgi:hypothetical protein
MVAVLKSLEHSQACRLPAHSPPYAAVAAQHAGEFVINEFARIKYKQARLLGFKPPFVQPSQQQLRAKL